MKKKTVKSDRICFECLHYEACQSWNIGSLVKTAADNCVNYRASVDVRPVVTCADCKHWTRIKKDCILASCDLDALVRCEDFYCANGEKREES